MKRIIRKSDITVPNLIRHKRVAAYARVSSGKEAMLHSLSAQVSYYSDYIQKHSGWEYIGVYADEALTGTKENRPEFQRLLADCRDGKIDMIITKSISRLARNTITMLETVRELKNINVDVYFEKENIHSISGDGELMLTILASFAQEESFSASENCKWRIRNKFKEGIPYRESLIGYHLKDNQLQIIPHEAEIVRMIFNDYLLGMGKNAIIKKLNSMGIKTRSGKQWGEKTVDRILRNEKYVGDMLLQKMFSSNHIEKQKCINKGQLPMYYVKDSHEAIIERNTFELVQQIISEKAERFQPPKHEIITYPFTSKIICSQCRKHYQRKINNAGTKYAKPVWICSTFNRLGKSACPSQQIPEDILLSVTTEVLGLSKFIETVFEQQIKNIQVLGSNTIIFAFNNGSTAEKQWQYKSRKCSWSAEAKQLAHDKQFEYLEGRETPCQQ